MSIMCVYQDCLSVKYPCNRKAFFRLPSDDRRSTWIRNSGNKSLLKIGPKAQRFFCENHFRECDINSQFTRKLLRRDAVPIEHASLRPSKQDAEKPSTYAEVSIDSTNDPKPNLEHTELIENFEENTEYQNLFNEIKVLDTSTTTETDTTADANCSVPYRLLNIYCDDDEESSIARIITEKADENITKTENPQQRELLEIYLEENSNNNQVDSSTVELEEQSDLEDIENFDDDTREFATPAKKKRPNEMEISIETPSSENVEIPTQNNNSYEEDKHFALSLVGYFQRLPQGKKSMAKLKILQYLTDLEIDLPTSL